MLNNREVSVIFWLSVFIVWALSQKNIRESIFNIVKVFFEKKIIIPILLAVLYASLIIYVLSEVKLWNNLLIKDTIYWFLGTALILMINSNKANQDDRYFRKIFLKSLGAVVAFEFIINLYPFSLITEIILVPFLTFIIMLITVAEMNKEHDQVRRILSYFLTFISVYIIYFIISNIINDFDGFATINNLRTFILPPILSIGFLPFIYIMALWIKYDEIFIRLKIGLDKDVKLARFAKRKIFRFCHLNLRKINEFSRTNRAELMRIKSKADILDIIQQFNSNNA